jgi:hypothetical protein
MSTLGFYYQVHTTRALISNYDGALVQFFKSGGRQTDKKTENLEKCLPHHSGKQTAAAAKNSVPINF